MRRVTPFRINTSKKSRHLCIALILNDFNPTRINTSVIFRFKPSGINTSKKHGGRGYVHLSPIFVTRRSSLATRSIARSTRRCVIR